MAEKGLLRDVQARQVPVVSLGPEFTLPEKLSVNSRFHAFVSRDGHPHVFAVDRKGALHHIEISGNAVLMHEAIGSLTSGISDVRRPDAIEHPQGILRVVAGDKMFVRSGNGLWTEIKGNRCERFIMVGEDLLCTFIAKGEDLGAPKRTDWIVGWFILVPVVLWSDVHADKLVIAKEFEDGWTILAVFDPEATLSIRSDYVLGADRGGLHFLYRSSGGSYAFVVGPAGGAGAIGGTDISDQQISSARIDYETLVRHIADYGSGSNKHQAGWLRVTGNRLQAAPFTDRSANSTRNWNILNYVLDGRYAVNGVSSDIEGVILVQAFGMDDGARQLGGIWDDSYSWAEIRIKGDSWAPRFDIVTANDLPESGWSWNSTEAILKKDADGNSHLLLTGQKGFWGPTEICYFAKMAENWSAPVTLGRDVMKWGKTEIALDEKGNALAIWKDKNGSVKARWILRDKKTDMNRTADK